MNKLLEKRCLIWNRRGSSLAVGQQLTVLLFDAFSLALHQITAVIKNTLLPCQGYMNPFPGPVEIVD